MPVTSIPTKSVYPWAHFEMGTGYDYAGKRDEAAFNTDKIHTYMYINIYVYIV